MYCNHCGQPTPEASAFCPSCGAVLDGSDGNPGRRQSETRDWARDEVRAQPESTDRSQTRAQSRVQTQERYPSRPSEGMAPPYRPSASEANRHRGPARQVAGRPSAPRTQAASIPPQSLWIERDDALGAIMRHFHAQDHRRWRMLATGAAIVCGISLLLPWFTISFFGYEMLDFFNVFGDGVRCPDWPVIALASIAVVVTLYLGHPMWSLIACVFLCYFAITNTTSLFYTMGFTHPALGFFIYVIAAMVTTYGCLASGGLEELNLFLPTPPPSFDSSDYATSYPTSDITSYPDPTSPHIPRGNGGVRG